MPFSERVDDSACACAALGLQVPPSPPFVPTKRQAMCNSATVPSGAEASPRLPVACLRQSQAALVMHKLFVYMIDSDKRVALAVPVQAPLAGNSIHIDKVFLQRYMPRLHEYLHFRIIDVSTLNELGKRWTPGKLQFLPRKTNQHTAMADLLESLEELRVYQSHMFGINQKGHPIFLQYQPQCPRASQDGEFQTSSALTAAAVDSGASAVKRVGRQIRKKR